MGLEAFIGIVFTTILGVLGYLLVRKDEEARKWRERMEQKVDDIPKNILLELGNYVHVETHNAAMLSVDASIASAKRDTADLDRRVTRVEKQLGLR